MSLFQIGTGSMTSSHFVQCEVIFVYSGVLFHHYPLRSLRSTVDLNLVRVAVHLLLVQVECIGYGCNSLSSSVIDTSGFLCSSPGDC